MAATVYLSESNTAGEVVTDNITNINFGSVDQANLVAANHPIIQSEDSYTKFFRVKVNALGGSTTIKDLRLWKSAGMYGTGEVIGIFNPEATNVWTNFGPPSPVHQVINAVPTADPGTANLAIDGAYANTITTAPKYSSYFFMQLHTTGSTPLGPVIQKTITVQYDET